MAAAIAMVVALGLAGYVVVQARAAGGTPRQALAPVTLPTAKAAAYQRWTVGRVLRRTVAHTRPASDAPLKVKLPAVTANGYPTLVLVDTVRTVGEETWYKVWLAVRPNGSRAWIREGELAFYSTAAKIVIDLSERRLSVYRRGRPVGSYPVAVGRPGLETPTGFFFVNQKLRPPQKNGPYGVLALGISAFQPKLPDWPQGGPVAIHGTNQDDLIGKAVSNGCVRMHNKDILAVSAAVPSGSPVIVQP